MAARKPSQSDLDATRVLLTQLGLEVCHREQEFREERRVRTGLKLSGLPVGKPLESFDFAFQRSVDKSQIDLLAASEFVRRGELPPHTPIQFTRSARIWMST